MNYDAVKSIVKNKWWKNYFSPCKKGSSKVKISESIRGKKKAIEKSLTFAYDSVKIEDEKEEVLECSLVTTS